MTALRPYSTSRRVFLADLGKVAIGMAVFGVAACSEGTAATTTRAGADATTGLPSTTTPSTTVDSTTEAPTTTTTRAPTTTAAVASAWERVVLGSVSAYIIVRAGEAAVVDTGSGGAAGDIEAALRGLGVGWDAVGHVILTHDHPDHQGSLPAVMEAASGATAYAGAADIPDIRAPRPIVAVGDGDVVAGLDVIATPGHTRGHITLLDRELSLLMAGDAMVGDAGGVAGPVPRFTADLAEAHASVAKLAGFDFDAVVFGHGEPVPAGGTTAVAELAASL